MFPTLASLTDPLSEADPCGPDLEVDDDDAYLNAVVSIETVLPPEYFVFSDLDGSRRPFDQDRRYQDLNIGLQIQSVVRLSDETRDLRLIVLLAKLAALSKNLDDTATCVEATRLLLRTQWEGVHPRSNGADLTVRNQALQRLDDPLMVTALQHVPLFASKRHGVITWHRYTTEVRKSTDGPADGSAFERTLADDGQADLATLLAGREDLAKPRATLSSLRQALTDIRAVYAEHEAAEPPAFPALEPLVGQMAGAVERIFRLIEGAVVRLDPSAASEPVEETDADTLLPDGGTDDVGSDSGREGGHSHTIDSASAELAAVIVYFQTTEPSSPALLILRQAETLIGRSFLEAMQLLLPEHVAKATLDLGTHKTILLPLTRLGEGQAKTSERRPSSELVSGSAVLIGSRREAIVALGRIGAFFQHSEPSSPVPMLIDRAKGTIGKDFMSLLGDLLPGDILKTPVAPKAR